MAETRPSGNPPIPDAKAIVVQEVSQIGSKGRFHILPRWAKRLGWLPVPATTASEALMVFSEPGILSLRSWEPDGPRIMERYDELAQLGKDADLEALRAIQDRYGKLAIPRERRVYLGDAALQHLDLPLTRNMVSSVYVVIYPGWMDLLTPTFRNKKNIEGHPLLDDLP